jgi:hypothetical protein
MAQRVDPYTAAMREPEYRPTVLAAIDNTGVRLPRPLDEWARSVAFAYGKSGSLEVTAVVWALLAELDRRDQIHAADEAAMLRTATEPDRLRALAEWLVVLDDTSAARLPDRQIMTEAIRRAREALGRTEEG